MNNDKFNYEPLYDAQRPLQERKRWDVFENPPVKTEIGSVVQKRWIDVGERCAKIFAYIITFIIVLGGAVISKGTLMFMISQLSNVTRPYCNIDLDRNKQFQVTLPETERLAWMWLIMFAFFVPQIGTFLRSARKLIYKSWKRPEPLIFRLVFVSETLMTVGIAIFVFAVLPRLDSVKALMLTNAVCFIPAVLSFVGSLVRKFRDDEYKADPNWFVTLAFDLLSVLAQASAFIIWPMIEDDTMLWLTVASGILISCGWWENFVPLPSAYKKMVRFENGRYYIYIFVSLWKCVVFFASMVAIVWIKEGYPDRIFNDFIPAFQTHSINITEVRPIIEGVSSSIVEDVVSVGLGTTIKNYSLAPVWVFVINVLSTWLCYIVGKWACKINIQGFSYSFPINLTVPVALSILIAMCGFYMTNECSFYNTIPLYLFFNSPPMYDLNHFITQQQSWIWLFWLLSQAWITVHTWMPKCEKLASTEKLFVRPMYEPFLIDQDLALNRRVDDGADWREEVQEEEFLLDTVDMSEERVADFTTPHPDDNITRIYACATMWHETKEEMMEFLKSIFRMDEDHNARRTVREQFHFNLPDYYEIETHIFFDDAFVRVSQDDPDPQINDWVKTLVDSIDEAASVVHEVNIRLRPPKKFITPYGGRLAWTLPGKTKMIAHLKDKKKIRAKKRWSQVMYMYYLLGHRLMERTDICSARKDVIGENTFILALDGDIDFQPKAVHLLVDLMKKNKTLGAACGRIHPLGSGPLVWYQMFEYAIGHWMQKATEHVIGCVLCSPGCFSLFRGKSLMDDSVMRKYTTKSSEARHYVQYDQGEDRWLCTLLLQRGYRVEYAAASDAFTHCPEGFNEFYNQRRRWMPSTMANILDLLMNAGPTIKINDNISRGYIAYQGLLMAGTILGPGTIFLMLIGSFVAVFQLSQWESLLWNAVPLGTFLITCALFSKDKIQLFMAGVLSLVYSLVMMAVFIGIALQARSDGILAPSSLFFFCVIMQFVIAALLHPKEMVCLLYIGVYYVTVPSMYMLLVIYSVFNMNNVSWGTREVTVMQAAQNAANSPTPGADKKKEKKDRNWIISWCGAKPEETGGAIEFSIASLLRCVLCTNLDKSQNPQLTEINKALLSIQARLEKIEGSSENEEEVYSHPPRRSTRTMAGFGIVGTPSIDNQSLSDESSEVIENTWIDDPVLQRGEVEFISSEEYEFWNGLLDKYLHPIDDTKDKARIAQDLKNLRDKVVLAFFMLNAVFVLIIFLLTLNKDVLYIEWPLGYSVNFTYVEDNQIRIYKSYLELEPIGIIFLALFASLLIIQFFGMLFHRFQTFSQIVANTPVSFTCWKQSEKKLTEDEVLEQDPVDVAKKLQKLKGADDLQEDLPEDQVGRRKTIHLIDNRFRNPKETITDLDTAFKRRYGKITDNENYQGPIRRDTVMAIERRKSRLTRPSGLAMGRRNIGFVTDDSTI